MLERRGGGAVFCRGARPGADSQMARPSRIGNVAVSLESEAINTKNIMSMRQQSNTLYSAKAFSMAISK